ncbi:carboxypeptidase regulatory-like domain-containing protein [Mucilaginibacter sp. S1162]|uniref:Carboxypeptidase regulatory-like domain-containing protein n=1 Tax=Mucilaginibacter humi TaxID=2732510 RepID=A0ABX1W3D2_9SPHI|nr:carboxypeptidase-like regulatory domain-containing protein [Mucilaginibacter humi]NNU34493.1 carboxypeptidase regulatory-like domain-containing protein [Mucilaginibacter humi]
MKLFKLAFLAIWGCLCLNFADAQTTGSKISGTITDQNNKAVDGATVSLVTAKDSAVIKTVIANADGSFVFDNFNAVINKFNPVAAVALRVKIMMNPVNAAN